MLRLFMVYSKGHKLSVFLKSLQKPLSTHALKAGQPCKVRVESWESGQRVWCWLLILQENCKFCKEGLSPGKGGLEERKA